MSIALAFTSNVADSPSTNIFISHLLREYTAEAMKDVDGISVRQYFLPRDILEQQYSRLGRQPPADCALQPAIPAVPAQLDANGAVIVEAIDGIPASEQTIGSKPTRHTYFVPPIAAGSMTSVKQWELAQAQDTWTVANTRSRELQLALEGKLSPAMLQEFRTSPDYWTLDARGLYNKLAAMHKMTKQDVHLLDELLAKPPSGGAESSLEGAKAWFSDISAITGMYPPAYPKTPDQLLDLIRTGCDASKIYAILVNKFDDRFPDDNDKTLLNLRSVVVTHFQSVLNQCERLKTADNPSAHASRAVSAVPAQRTGASKQPVTKQATCDRWASAIGGCTNAKCRYAHPPGQEGSQPNLKRSLDRIKQLNEQLRDTDKVPKPPAKDKNLAMGKGRQPARGDAKRGSGSAASAAGGGGAASAAAASDEEEEYDT